MKCVRLMVVAALLAGLAAAAWNDGFDWPCWRGPDGNGISKETDWDAGALAGGPKVLWTADIGMGYSSVAIKDDRLFTMGWVKGKSSVSCLKATTGDVIWQSPYEDFLQPQSTPTVDGDRVYGLRPSGTLFCLQASDGAVLWEKGLTQDFSARRPTQYWATSLVVDGNLLLVNANTLELALDKATGDVAWSIEDTVPEGSWGSYATPVICDVEGRRCALFLGPSVLNAVDVAAGKKLWSYSHQDVMHPVADPIVSKSQVFISLQHSCALLEITGDGSRVLWSSSEFDTSLPAPVLVNGYMYGTHFPHSFNTTTWGGVQEKPLPFRCIDWSTGDVVWQKDMKYVSLTAAAGKLLMLELNGTLHVAEATASSFRELANMDVLQGAKRPRTFATPPVLCNGLIYCRNFAGDLICIDVRKR